MTRPWSSGTEAATDLREERTTASVYVVQEQCDDNCPYCWGPETD